MHNTESQNKFVFVKLASNKGERDANAVQRNKRYAKITTDIAAEHLPSHSPSSNHFAIWVDTGSSLAILWPLGDAQVCTSIPIWFATLGISAYVLYMLITLVRRCRQVYVDPKNQQTFNEGKKMGIFLEEGLNKDFISEKLLEEQLEDVKKQLEKISRCESLDSILAEELCKVEKIINQSTYTKNDVVILSTTFSRIASNINNFANRYKRKIANESYENLKFRASVFTTVSKIFFLAVSPTPNLKSKDSLRSLKKWSEILETYADFIDGCKDIPLEAELWLKKLCIDVIEVTDNVYVENPKKEKYRRLLRNSAAFILQWVQTYKSEEVKEFTLGNIAPEKLLEETKSRLHLLDLLSPSNNEEAKEQKETRQHLTKMLDN